MISDFKSTMTFPVDAKVTFEGKPAKVIRTEPNRRFIEFIKPGPMQAPRKWVDVADLKPDESPYAPLPDTAPEPAPNSTVAVPIPPRPDAAPDTDTQPVEVPPVVVDARDDLTRLLERVALLEREKAEANQLVAEANEAVREAIAAMTHMKTDRDAALQESASLREGLARMGAGLLELRSVLSGEQDDVPAPKLRKEFSIMHSIPDATMERMVAEGWQVEHMQFVAVHDEWGDVGQFTRASVGLYVVFSRMAPVPVTPPQPEARASVHAILTADFVRDSITPSPDDETEIDPAEPDLVLNKQPDSPRRTDALYQRRKAIIGQKKAGGFIAQANTHKKRQRESLAQRLAAGGMPIAAQIAATGVEDTKQILNAQAYAKAKAAYDAAVGNIAPSRPLIAATTGL